MKISIIILCLFLTTVTKAQWYEGSVLYKDGTVEKGFIKYFENARKDEIYFKSPDGKKKNIDSKKLKEIQFINEEDKEIIYLRLKPVTLNGPILDLFLTEASYSWFSLYYRGEFDVVSQVDGILNHYIHMPGTETAVRVQIVFKGSSKGLHTEDMLQAAAIEIFKDKCSEMVKAIKEKKFLPMNVDELIDYYEKNCATTTTWNQRNANDDF